MPFVLFKRDASARELACLLDMFQFEEKTELSQNPCSLSSTGEKLKSRARYHLCRKEGERS